MESENLYPNDGTFIGGVPLEPPDQTIERKRERAKTLEEGKILREVVVHLEKRIEFLNSVEAMPDEAKLDPEKFLIMHNSQEMAINHLKSEKEWLESLLDNVGQSGV